MALLERVSALIRANLNDLIDLLRSDSPLAAPARPEAPWDPAPAPREPEPAPWVPGPALAPEEQAR